jgi:hypothetical protein
MICIVFYFTLYYIVRLTKSPRVYSIGRILVCATRLGTSISVNTEARPLIHVLVV